LVAADLLDIRLLEVLGISLAAMGAISAAIFQFAFEGGAKVSVEGDGRKKSFKGEEYDVVLTVESRATDWIGSMPPTVKIETAELIKAEPLTEGKARLRFLGTCAGRAEDVEVGITLTDPLRLFKRLERVAYGEFVSDTLPLSLLAPSIPLRLTTFGFG
jgi:hypothetical protein